jgi:hypothetical protein
VKFYNTFKVVLRWFIIVLVIIYRNYIFMWWKSRLSKVVSMAPKTRTQTNKPWGKGKTFVQEYEAIQMKLENQYERKAWGCSDSNTDKTPKKRNVKIINP